MATNNRFKKSIERATDNTQESVLENTEDNIIDNTTKIIKSNASSNISNNILKKILESEKKEKGSNHTLYLSADVGDALNNLAKTSSKSKSALVDEILREILIN